MKLKKILFSLAIVFFSLQINAQITIDNTTYSPAQLIDGVLVPSTSGIVISNVVYRGVYGNDGKYQLGYFSNATTTLAQMGFANGLVLTTGNTLDIPLPLGVAPSSVLMDEIYSDCTPGLIQQVGACPTFINDINILTGIQDYFNATILEFDFVPVETSVSFRYVFGSEEYNDGNGDNYQCTEYNDKFGFLISGPGVNGGQGFTNDANNMAVLPNGSEVSINSVNDGVVSFFGNATECILANPTWIQNSPSAEFSGPIDGTKFNGNTRIQTASQAGLIPGQTYHIKLIISDVSDGSYDSVVYIEEGSFTPDQCDAGVDQSFCGGTSTTLAATSSSGGTWSVISGTGIFVSTTDPNTIVNGLSSGINVFRWSSSVSTCFNDVTIEVGVIPSQPTIASVAPTCSADGTSTITNYDNTLTYTFTPSGPTITATGLITGMTVGTSYTVVSSNVNCSSVTSASFSNAAMLIAPAQPLVTSVLSNCGTDGTSTISNYNISLNYTFTPSGPSIDASGLITGMTIGTNYTVISSNANCSSLVSLSFNNAAMLIIPSQPTIASVAPTCSADGTSTITNYDNTLTYTFTPSGPTITATGLITGMTVGTSYTVVSSNVNCSSVASASFSNAAMLIAPAQPLVTSVLSNCGTDGTSTISNYNISLNYTFTPSGPSIDASGLITGMTFGTNYTVIANNGSCSSTVSSQFFNNQSSPVPTVTFVNNTPSICSGSLTDIVLSSNVPGTVFTWNAVGADVNGSSNGTGATISQLLTASTNLVGEVVYTVIATVNGCSGAPVEVRVSVNPIPDVVATPTSETICSGTATNISFTGSITGTVFNWTVAQAGVSGASSGSGTSIQQTLTTTSLTASGTAVYTITPVLNGCAGTPVVVTVTVNPTPEILGTPTQLPICSGQSTNISVSAMDAATVFDYTVNAVGVTGATGGTIPFGTPIVQQLYTLTNVAGYVDYTIVPTLNGCSGTPIVIRVRVNPLPLPLLEDGAICVDSSGNTFQTYYFHTGLDNATHTFVWYYEGVIIAGATSTSYEAEEAGIYSVIVTNTVTGCTSEEVFGTVIETNPATGFTYTVTNAFTDNATIVVNVPDGNGTLMYQIDDEELQSSNVFTGVNAGVHTITVVDSQGCTYIVKTVTVIDYPKYFTPNGDGINDHWNIIGLQDQPGAKLYIFDRYGKLIKQISTTGQGWDGTFNGQQLPSTDYWFTIEFDEGGQQRVFRAHFSLIR